MLSSLQAGGVKIRTFSFSRQSIPLGILPTSAGYERREGPDYAWDGLRRGTTPFTIFQYTISGAGHLEDGRKTYRIEPGEAMVLTVPGAHQYWLEQDEIWEFLWFSLTGDEAVRLYEEIRRGAGPKLSLTPLAADQLAEICRQLLTLDPVTPFEASKLCYDATLILLEIALGLDRQVISAHSGISRVLSHIASQPRHKLDVGRMAEMAGLSRAHFSRVFTAATGFAPGNYLLNQKIAFAVRLMDDDPTMTIKQAAELTGFADANYFSKAFRRVTGMAPSEYRALGYQEDPARPR